MLVNDMVRLSTRMFKTNPGRTWLTILGMGVGTSAVVMLVGLGFGLQGILLEQIVFGDTLLSLNVNNPPTKVVMLNEQTMQEFLKIPQVDDASPLASFPALMTLGELTGNINLQGVSPSYFRYTGVIPEKGELFKVGEEDQSRDQIILSKASLKLFQIENPEDMLGKKVKFRIFMENPETKENKEVSIEKEYTVRAVTNDAGSINAFMLMKELTSHVEISTYERVQVKVSNTNYLNQVQDEIIKRGFLVTALSKTVEQANKIFQGIQMVLAAFGGIALVVSAIGMFNTMTVTLLERTNEIGIMRTIGASPRDIKILFLSESIVVGFLGGLVGMSIGVGGGMAMNLLMNIIATTFGGVAVKLFRFPLLFLTFIAAFSAVVGLLTGVFPATRAAKLNPLDAIRYK